MKIRNMKKSNKNLKNVENIVDEMKIEEKEIKNDINTTKDRLYDAEKKNINFRRNERQKKKKKVRMKKKLL